MRCDVCGWRTSMIKYDGQNECFCCFEGLMVSENNGSLQKEKNGAWYK